MKRSIISVLAFLLVVLTACGQKPPVQPEETTPQPPTWQEQYDLGVRYLSEGNYEEAIIAFTAAIEIDPKRAEAYIERGNAYIGSGETAENLALAFADYETVISIDATNAEAYLGLADVYTKLGNEDKAVEILEQGYQATKGEELKTYLEKLMSTDDAVYMMDVPAVLIVNAKTYEEEIDALHQIYHENSAFDMFGIRFTPALNVLLHGDATSVYESGLSTKATADLRLYDGTQENFEDFYKWEYFDRNMLVSGYLTVDEDYDRIRLTEDGHYLLDPNGPYHFQLTQWQFADTATDTREQRGM